MLGFGHQSEGLRRDCSASLPSIRVLSPTSVQCVSHDGRASAATLASMVALALGLPTIEEADADARRRPQSLARWLAVGASPAVRARTAPRCRPASLGIAPLGRHRKGVSPSIPADTPPHAQPALACAALKEVSEAQNHQVPSWTWVRLFRTPIVRSVNVAFPRRAASWAGSIVLRALSEAAPGSLTRPI